MFRTEGSKTGRFLNAWRGPAAESDPEIDVLERWTQLTDQRQHATDSVQLSATLQETFELTAAAIYLRNGDNTLHLAGASGPIAAPPSLPAAMVAQDGARFVPWRSLCAAPQPAIAEGGGEWSAGLPLQLDGQAIGLLAIGHKRNGGALEHRERALLALLGTQLAAALKGHEWMRQIEAQRIEIETLRRRIDAEAALVRSDVHCAPSFPYIVGRSPALHDALRMVERIAPTEATVLITGETGTGKELIARAVHDLSARRGGPLVSVNCPAIPLELAESELFGHERGAFTGAVDAHAGKLEMADGGTIFLDEVADLPMPVQVKLLRVLQEREVQRVGSHRTRRLDLRVVAATNRDLSLAVRSGQFREDLYYRLAAMPIHLPPLRDRTGDIRMLASHFLDQAAARYRKTVRGFSAAALDAIERHPWPGNIRELAHVIERAVLLCAADRIQLSELPGFATPPEEASLGATLRAEKRRRAETALFQCGGNQAAAARLLGMSRSNFARLVKTLGVRLPSLRPD